MLKRLFSGPQVVEPATANSIFETFSWALENFDAHFFLNKTRLVLPSSVFFPDRSDNEFDMAKALQRRIVEYCGLADWPFILVPPAQFSNSTPPVLGFNCASRGNKINGTSKNRTLETSDGQTSTLDITDSASLNSKVLNSVSLDSVDLNSVSFGSLASGFSGNDKASLELSYSPAMFKKPMDLVASVSGLVAQHYLLQSQLMPPAGYESFNETAELLSVFMGFGVLMANSAYTFRGSCAKCYDPRANRSAALPEHEVVFALALFCYLKKEPYGQAKTSLKPHLRSLFKKSLKQIENHKESLERLTRNLDAV